VVFRAASNKGASDLFLFETLDTGKICLIALECKYSDPSKTDNRRVTIDEIQDKITSLEKSIEPHILGRVLLYKI
jgi:hypothetical protein